MLNNNTNKLPKGILESKYQLLVAQPIWKAALPSKPSNRELETDRTV